MALMVITPWGNDPSSGRSPRPRKPKNEESGRPRYGGSKHCGWFWAGASNVAFFVSLVVLQGPTRESLHGLNAILLS